MTQYLFNRDWAVTIGPSGQKGNRYTKMHVVFDIDKTSQSTSNKGKIEIYNLSDDSRKKFQGKGEIIQLEAGYVGLLETLYIGDVKTMESKRKGPDVISAFECGEAEKELIYAHFQKSYPAGTQYVQIFKDLAQALGVGIGTVIGIQDQTVGSTRAFVGTIKRHLDYLTRQQGLKWSIQNNSLQIIPVSAHNGDEAVVISKETGLIGVPSKKEGGSVVFTSLLNPKLFPGSLVQIKSSAINGFFSVNRAHFEGDTHGDKWQVSCECIEIKAQQILPVNRGLDFKTVPSGTV